MRIIPVFIFLFLRLTAFGQSLSVSPLQLNFGIVNELSLDSQQVTITNTTGYTVTVTGYRFYDTYGSKAFSTSAGLFTIPDGSSQSIWIRFRPRHNVAHNSELMILNSANRGALRVDLLGQGRYSNSYYANTENLDEQVLKDSLKAIVSRNYFNAGYVIARDSMFMSYDNKKVNGQGATQNTIECVYTGRQAVGYIDRTDCQTNYDFNTEHTFPQGFFGSAEPMRADLFHLFPTDEPANNVRGNLPFGVVNNPTWQQGGSKADANNFEPRNSKKGVIARAMLYFVTRYQNYSGFLTNQEGILRQWHQQYPADSVEIRRCNAISLLQLNRNPFVDYPQFTERITTFSSTSVGNQAASTDTPDDTIRFGQVNVSVPAGYRYWIVNDGNQPLTISGLNLSPSGILSFTNGTGSPQIIQPGEAGFVDIELSNAPPGQTLSGTLNYAAQGNGLLALVSVPIRAQLSFTGQEELYTSSIQLYPNPATTQLCGRFDVIHSRDFRILDLAGRQVALPAYSGGDCLDISQVGSPGAYILEWNDVNFAPRRSIWYKQ
jgi:hypothetical protein